jgi:ABC-type phosphate transport system substrate-binding protein
VNASRLATIASIIPLALVVTLTGCGKKEPSVESGDAPAAQTGRDAPVIRIDGSSTVFPITEAVAEEYQIEKRGAVRVTVGLSGTGGGFKKLCRGDVDLSNASRPILAEEMELCRKSGISFYELPIAFDAITVVVNPKNEWVIDGRRPEENVGARGARQDHAVEPGAPGMARCAADVVRSGCRFGHVRLLY